MRLLISVLAMFVVGFLATQAKADLVADLRSGRSDIEAAPSSLFSGGYSTKGTRKIYIERLHEKLQSKPNYRAVAVHWYKPYASYGHYGASSAEAAVEESLSTCEKQYGGKCGVYSVGEKIVIGFSQENLAAAIEAYDRGNKKTTIARKSTEAKEEEAQGKYDGEWQGTLIIDCHGRNPQMISDVSIVNGAIDSVFSSESNMAHGELSYRFKGYVRNDGKIINSYIYSPSFGATNHGVYKENVYGKFESSSGRFTATSGGHCKAELTFSTVDETLIASKSTEKDPKATEAEPRQEEIWMEAESDLFLAERFLKEEEAQKLAEAERKRAEEERRLAEQKKEEDRRLAEQQTIVAQEARKLIPEIEAFAKTSPRQIDFLLLLELFHKAKPVTEGAWSEELRDDYLALRKLVINEPEFIAFQEAAKVRQAEERRTRIIASRSEVSRATAFLKHFVVENFSSPSAPLAVSVIGSLEEALSSEDLETLQTAAANFSSFVDREKLQVQLSDWESEFGDSIVAEADEEAPAMQEAEVLDSQDIPANTASQTDSDILLEDIFSSYTAIKNANVRELPTAKSPQVGTLPKGSEVTALGKVTGKNWYLVARDGKELGYVFGSLIAEADTVASLKSQSETERTRKKEEARQQAHNPDAIAVVIGNKNYAGNIPEVSFAHNDANAVRRYLVDTLGYREGNIIDVRDTTKGELEAIFGNRSSYKGKLFNYTRAHVSDVTVFYSGHGVPDTKSRRGYLLPVDADPDIVSITGFPLDLLFENLAQIPARSMNVFLDACFSGDSPKGMIIRATSGITVTAKVPQKDDKILVITASQGDQYASWDEDAEHGLFTKHLLEALGGAADTARYGNSDGQITASEVKKYLDTEMTYQARRRYGREQNVWVSGEMERILVQLGSQN